MSKFFIAAILATLSFSAVDAQDFDTSMSSYGLVDIQSIDDEILVELKYSSTDNFVGEDMYGNFLTNISVHRYY